MNEKVNKFLLARDKFMPEMHLKQPRVTVDHLLKRRKELKNLKKQDIQAIFTNYIYKTAFNSIWLMEILKI